MDREYRPKTVNGQGIDGSICREGEGERPLKVERPFANTTS